MNNVKNIIARLAATCRIIRRVGPKTYLARCKHAARLRGSDAFILLTDVYKEQLFAVHLARGKETGNFSTAHQCLALATSCVLASTQNIYADEDKERHDYAARIMILRDRWKRIGQLPTDLGSIIICDGVAKAETIVKEHEARQPRGEITKKVIICKVSKVVAN